MELKCLTDWTEDAASGRQAQGVNLPRAKRKALDETHAADDFRRRATGWPTTYTGRLKARRELRLSNYERTQP